jgi:4-amino-4-deoxy-L-arabinose transferase-like glycosyltransferase
VRAYFKSLFAFLVFLLLFQSLVISVADLRRPYWGDEEHFVETIREFGEGITLERLKQYNEMSTPLPFIVYAIWGRIFGFELHLLRLLSIVIALITYLAFHRLLWRLFDDARIAFLAGAFLAVHPYMVGFSIFVYTDMLPILFLILACIAVINRSAFVLGVSSACAVLCRQHYVFLAIATALCYLLDYLHERNTEGSSPKGRGRMSMLLASILSVVPLALLFAFWQGLSPDNAMRARYLQEGFSFHPSSFILYVALLFVYLAPIVLVKWRTFYARNRVLIVGFVISWVYWLFPVGPSKFAIDIDVHTVGLFHRLLQWIYPGRFFEQVIFYLAFLLGLPILIFVIESAYQKIKQRDCSFSLFLDLSILMFLIVLPFSYMCWEKYFMPLVPLVTIRTLLIGYEGGDAAKSDKVTVW